MNDVIAIKVFTLPIEKFPSGLEDLYKEGWEYFGLMPSGEQGCVSFCMKKRSNEPNNAQSNPKPQE